MNTKLVYKSHTNSKSNGATKLIACAVLAFSFLSNQASYAAEPQEVKVSKTHFSTTMKQGRHNKMNHMIKKLQLDSKQQADIKVIKKSAKEQNKALFESLKQYHSELELLIRADFFDEQAITNLHNAYQVNLAQAALTKAKTRHAILQILTAEQKDKWFTIVAKRAQKKMHKGY